MIGTTPCCAGPLVLVTNLLSKMATCTRRAVQRHLETLLHGKSQLTASHLTSREDCCLLVQHIGIDWGLTGHCLRTRSVLIFHVTKEIVPTCTLLCLTASFILHYSLQKDAKPTSLEQLLLIVVSPSHTCACDTGPSNLQGNADPTKSSDKVSTDKTIQGTYNSPLFLLLLHTGYNTADHADPTQVAKADGVQTTCVGQRA